MNRMFYAPTVSRLRSFLHRQGFRLKPWCTQEEILESFYRQLADERHGDEFWMQLQDLAAALALDLKQRQPGSALVNAMVLEPANLIYDIRVALANVQKEPSGYRALSTALPQTAIALLLAVSLSAVGCGGAVDDSSHDVNRGGAAGASNNAENNSIGGAVIAAGGASLSGQGGTNFGTAGTTSVASNGGTAGATGGTNCADPPPAMSAILDACGIDPLAKQTYLDALNACDASWPQGVAAYFACKSCGDVAAYINNCYDVVPHMEPYAGDPGAMCFRPMPVYMALQFTGATRPNRALS